MNYIQYARVKKSLHSVPSRHRSNGVNITVGLPSRDRSNSKHGTLAHFSDGGVTNMSHHSYACTLNTVKFCACLREDNTGISAGRGTTSNAA